MLKYGGGIGMSEIWSGLPNRYKKQYRKSLVILLVGAACALIGFGYRMLATRVPDRIILIANREENFDFDLPLEAEVHLGEASQAGTFFFNNQKLTQDELHINLNDSFSVQGSEIGSYSVVVRLFGRFTMKQSVLDVIESVDVIPLGVPIGIIAKTEGVLVLGTGNLTDAAGNAYEPDAVVKTGDYITEVGQKAVNGKEELIAQIQACESKEAELTVRRGEECLTVKLPVVETASGDKKIGIWVRDDTQGIGTLTYITSDGRFGALGHGITDVDTGVLMEFEEGTIYTAEITSIIKGKSGEPGELSGVIHQGERARLGTMEKNTSQGIYGALTAEPELFQRMFAIEELKPYEIGFRNQAKEGAATILCTVDGQPKEYAIEIEKIKANVESVSKSLVIRITDENLLALTGGIVQGLSGSPIIQDGKLIGAVTHVLVNDPTRGYGIFIENMLDVQDEKNK